MRLIKDLIDDRIVYYWMAEMYKISPLIPSIAHVEEWYVKFHYESYMGEERRNSHIDRRKLYTSRERLRGSELIPTDPIGRRITDKSFEVHEDFSKEKIQKLIEIQSKLDD